MPTFADIAIPNVPRDTLTYSVPEGLRGSVLEGLRVVVPLGRRFVTGYVVRVHDEEPAMRARPVAEVLDAQPVFSDTLLRLAAWMARYYLTPLGDVLRAALPQGIDVASARHVALATDDEPVLDAAVHGSKTRARIVEALRTGELIREDALAALLGLRSITRHLLDLANAGAVRLESVMDAPRVRVRTVNAVRLRPPWDRDERMRELMELLERRAPRQVNILAVLWKARQQGVRSLVMAELLAQAHASAAQVRALEEKDIVEVFEEEVLREPGLRFTERPKRIVLTDAQRAVLAPVCEAVSAGGYTAFLLHGVTGSGKTQVYIDAIRHARSLGRNALMLVPEIALTPQLVARFRHAFGTDVTVMHSRMSAGERFDAWRATLEGRVGIVVGVRSAVFAPLANVGLIVVDEEHEASYKQSDLSPRYHARDAAAVRASIEGAALLLGSATPSAESWYNARAGKYRLLSLPERIDGAALPDIAMVDMAEARKARHTTGAFSHALVEAIAARIERKQTAIILHNRRGYAPQIECRDCGYVEECSQCSISLVYHKDTQLLRCHYCGASARAPVHCPRCGGSELDLIGVGTQRVEEDVRDALPAARVLRMDMDTTRKKGAHDLLLTAFAEGEADVLLGTQMVAKGLDFEQVTLVGVIAAEQSLLLPDFRAGERTFQLLTQVSGRAGRGRVRGEVLLQAMKPDHPVFLRVLAHDYEGFIEAELDSRRTLFYPPFSRLVHVLCSGLDERRVAEIATGFHAVLSRRASFYRLHPAQPALLKKIANRFRWQLIARVDKGRDPDGRRFAALLHEAEEAVLRLPGARSVRIDIDVDPQQML